MLEQLPYLTSSCSTQLFYSLKFIGIINEASFEGVEAIKKEKNDAAQRHPKRIVQAVHRKEGWESAFDSRGITVKGELCSFWFRIEINCYISPITFLTPCK